MNKVKTIFFDAAGTLIHLPRSVGFHYADVAARHGWAADASLLERAFGKAWKAAPSPLVTREPRADDDRSWWRQLVDASLDLAHAPSELQRGSYFEELYAEFVRPGVWELFPEVRPVLDALAPQYVLGIVSNFDGRLRTILADLDVLGRFEHVVISSEVGADKPDPWIFECALRVAGHGAGETLLVGDDLECDVRGAQKAGWQAFHVDRPRQTLRDLLPLLS